MIFGFLYVINLLTKFSKLFFNSMMQIDLNNIDSSKIKPMWGKEEFISIKQNDFLTKKLFFDSNMENPNFLRVNLSDKNNP